MANRINTTIVAITVVGERPTAKDNIPQPESTSDMDIDELYRYFDRMRNRRERINQRVRENKKKREKLGETIILD